MLREVTSCLCSAVAPAVCFKGRVAGVNATETRNEVSQPTLEFIPLLSVDKVLENHKILWRSYVDGPSRVFRALRASLWSHSDTTKSGSRAWRRRDFTEACNLNFMSATVGEKREGETDDDAPIFYRFPSPLCLWNAQWKHRALQYVNFSTFLGLP